MCTLLILQNNYYQVEKFYWLKFQVLNLTNDSGTVGFIPFFTVKASSSETIRNQVMH